MSSGSKCPKIGPGLCVYACAYVDPVLTSQSYDISIGTKRMNVSVLLLVMLMLMPPVSALLTRVLVLMLMR